MFSKKLPSSKRVPTSKQISALHVRDSVTQMYIVYSGEERKEQLVPRKG